MMQKNLLILGTILAVAELTSCSSVQAGNPNDPMGKCYGVVGPMEGDCGGKDPKTGQSWSCSGQNPTADLGWKEMTKSECDSLHKHKLATKKSFVANK